MFVGHALLAFALVAACAARLGQPSRRALTLGAVAGAFAAAPDVDMAYALAGLLGAEGGPLALAGSFWATSTLVHRAMTHSLVVAIPVALAAAAWVRGGSLRPVAALIGLSLVAVAAATSGGLGAFVMALFVVAALAIAAVVRHRTALSPRDVLVVALAGLLSHPFGDVFTGEPPAFLYPFDPTILAGHVVVSADPTLHLLAAFAVELAAIWAGVLVALRLVGVRATVAPRATLGAGYAASILVVPAPTLDLSYPFVFSVLAVGTVALLPAVRTERVDAGRGGLRLRRRGRGFAAHLPAPADVTVALRRPDATTALLTALSAVTLAWAGYGAAYLLVF